MRYIAIGFSLLAAACTGSSPAAPTASGSPVSERPAITAAATGSEFALKGSLHATEAVDGSHHHLTGTGNGTHLGTFSYAADIVVDETTGNGTGTVVWTAANGDEIHANTAGEIVSFDLPMIGLRETQTVTGGTGRFANASGTVVVERSLNLDTGLTAGSFSGTLNRGR